MYKKLKILYALAMVFVFSKCYSSNSGHSSFRNNRNLGSFVVSAGARPIIAPPALVTPEELEQRIQDFCRVIMVRMRAVQDDVVDVSINVRRDISSQETRFENLRLQVVRLEDQLKAQSKQIENMQGTIDALQQVIHKLEYENAGLQTEKLAKNFFAEKPFLVQSRAGQGAVGSRSLGQRRGQASEQGTARPSPVSSCLSIGSDDRQGASIPVE